MGTLGIAEVPNAAVIIGRLDTEDEIPIPNCGNIPIRGESRRKAAGGNACRKP
jgi:hypothetical protein